MYIAINKRGEIKGVGVTTNPELTSVYIKDDENPFDGWSKAKICCYKVVVKDGVVMMMCPYIDSRLLDNFDYVGKETEFVEEEISFTNDGLIETYEATLTNESKISDCESALIELYEMIIGE